jgi:transcriptional regulator with XRE-family HTH domain
VGKLLINDHKGEKMPTMTEPIGERIHRLRRERLLSASELAQMAGISRTTLHNIESGQTQTEPRPRTLRKIAAALEVKPIDLTRED